MSVGIDVTIITIVLARMELVVARAIALAVLRIAPAVLGIGLAAIAVVILRADFAQDAAAKPKTGKVSALHLK